MLENKQEKTDGVIEWETQVQVSTLPFEREIRLEKVSFSCQPQLPLVLHQLYLGIPKGARVSFIGITGSGKSTAMDLLMGPLQPRTGQILVDNTHPHDLPGGATSRICRKPFFWLMRRLHKILLSVSQPSRLTWNVCATPHNWRESPNLLRPPPQATRAWSASAVRACLAASVSALVSPVSFINRSRSGCLTKPPVRWTAKPRPPSCEPLKAWAVSSPACRLALDSPRWKVATSFIAWTKAVSSRQVVTTSPLQFPTQSSTNKDTSHAG